LFPEMRAEGHSRLTYELEEKGEAVKLTLIHEIDRADSKLIASTTTGWPPILSSLKSLLETGEPLEETRRWPEGFGSEGGAGPRPRPSRHADPRPSPACRPATGSSPRTSPTPRPAWPLRP